MARMAVITGFVLLISFAYLTMQLWLVFFASILGAVMLTAVARVLARLTHLPAKVCLACILLLAIAGLVIGIWAVFPPIAAELRSFVEEWPRHLEQFKQSWIGHQIMNGSGGSILSELQAYVDPVAGTALTMGTALSYVGVGLALALFLAATPATHRRQIQRAFPPAMRSEVDDFLDACARALEHWLLGQVVAMAFIAVIMVSALQVLGVAYPLTLGLLAGLCQFVPYVGPLLWVIPAAAIAATNRWMDAGIVVGVYLVVQVFEGNLLTPLIQRQAVELPPVVTILGAVMAGLIFGPLGILLATPLLVLGLVTYDRYWLQRIEKE